MESQKIVPTQRINDLGPQVVSCITPLYPKLRRARETLSKKNGRRSHSLMIFPFSPHLTVSYSWFMLLSHELWITCPVHHPQSASWDGTNAPMLRRMLRRMLPCLDMWFSSSHRLPGSPAVAGPPPSGRSPGVPGRRDPYLDGIGWRRTFVFFPKKVGENHYHHDDDDGWFYVFWLGSYGIWVPLWFHGLPKYPKCGANHGKPISESVRWRLPGFGMQQNLVFACKINQVLNLMRNCHSIHHITSWRFPKMWYPQIVQPLDQFSVKTHDDSGISLFQNPANNYHSNFCGNLT